MTDDIVTAIYGELYNSANTQVQLIQKAIDSQCNIGFESDEECAKWAHEHLLDLVVIGRSQHQFYYLTHRGDILKKRAWIDCYCSDTLFVWDIDKNEKCVPRPWIPKGFKYHNDARINGEHVDRDRLPIYHRDYFTPSGFYDQLRGTFNIAEPFPCYAKHTGRDTSHIYTYINAIAGECALHLLAWLRMKMCYPNEKTQVVPIIVSKGQGTGKTTFAEVICKGLFGKNNVLVTDQYDSQSRFNADYADALIVCHEEKDHEDKRNSSASIKSRATATTIRKENKGQDPVYQASYTDFIMTTNKEVPVKFDDDTDQRRFMVMEADNSFTRKLSPTADDVFTKLYGQDINSIKQGVPFVEDIELIQQFKHELYSREDIKATEVRKFPHTAAYKRCFTLPRGTDTTVIDSIVRSLAPFIKASLLAGHVKQNIVLNEGTDYEEPAALSMYLQIPAAMQYFPTMGDQPAFIALCRPLVFYDQTKNEPYAHATVERELYNCDQWLVEDYGLRVYPITTPIPGGFFGIQGRHRNAPTARFMLAEAIFKQAQVLPMIEQTTKPVVSRLGERLRVNGKWRPDPNGEFETVNEMKPGVITLENKNNNVQYMDTFLFEADDTTKVNYMLEQDRLQKGVNTAERLFFERLRTQRAEAERLFKQGIAARIVYSGGKSYHILVRIKDTPNTLDEYKWLHAKLCIELSSKLSFDTTTADPARLTRAPIMFERTFDYCGYIIRGQQRCLHTNWNAIFDYPWRILYEQWLNRPLDSYEETFGKRLVPTKQEYRDAMSALLHGTFWTDAQWNGQRQQCFFPGYRLCRYLGYTHDQLWAEGGILEGLNKYYRRNEIEYWRSRRTSDIVKQIDKDIEANE